MTHRSAQDVLTGEEVADLLRVSRDTVLGTRYDVRHLMIPFMDRRVGSDLKCLSLHFNAACKLTDKLAIGVWGCGRRAHQLEW